MVRGVGRVVKRRLSGLWGARAEVRKRTRKDLPKYALALKKRTELEQQIGGDLKVAGNMVHGALDDPTGNLVTLLPHGDKIGKRLDDAYRISSFGVRLNSLKELSLENLQRLRERYNKLRDAQQTIEQFERRARVQKVRIPRKIVNLQNPKDRISLGTPLSMQIGYLKHLDEVIALLGAAIERKQVMGNK